MAPLHVAAERGDRISMVNYLVDQGADINIKGDNRVSKIVSERVNLCDHTTESRLILLV